MEIYRERPDSFAAYAAQRSGGDIRAMLTILGSILLVSRLVHYLMIVSRRFPIILRPLSMLGTLGTILVSALLLLTHAG